MENQVILRSYKSKESTIMEGHVKYVKVNFLSIYFTESVENIKCIWEIGRKSVRRKRRWIRNYFPDQTERKSLTDRNRWATRTLNKKKYILFFLLRLQTCVYCFHIHKKFKLKLKAVLYLFKCIDICSSFHKTDILEDNMCLRKKYNPIHTNHKYTLKGNPSTTERHAS